MNVFWLVDCLQHIRRRVWRWVSGNQWALFTVAAAVAIMLRLEPIQAADSTTAPHLPPLTILTSELPLTSPTINGTEQLDCLELMLRPHWTVSTDCWCSDKAYKGFLCFWFPSVPKNMDLQNFHWTLRKYFSVCSLCSELYGKNC